MLIVALIDYIYYIIKGQRTVIQRFGQKSPASIGDFLVIETHMRDSWKLTVLQTLCQCQDALVLISVHLQRVLSD